MFAGDSYLQYTIAEVDSIRHSTDIELELMLDDKDGLVLWLGVDPTADDYLGLGVEDGLVKLVWNLGWFSRTELIIPDLNLTDSSWHRVIIERLGQQLEVSVDEVRYSSTVHGTYHQLDTSNILMIGSANNDLLVQDLTRGHFSQGFQVASSKIQLISNMYVSGLYEEYSHHGSVCRHYRGSAAAGAEYHGVFSCLGEYLAFK